MSICFIYWGVLLFFSVFSFIFGVYYLMFDYTLLIEIEMLSLNSCSIVMTLLFDLYFLWDL